MNNEQLNALRHSAAHMLAAAVLKLYPGAKLGIGPVIADGFYYDFLFPEGTAVSESDLPRIQKEMKKYIAQAVPFTGRTVSADEARAEEAEQPFKLELITELEQKGEEITLYTSGSFQDLCRGGHVENSSEIPVDGIKLYTIAGAYWKGNEKNQMLSRVYGYLFATKEELDAHCAQIEEAKKRDHRKLGKELDLFVFSELVGKGLPLFTPRGTFLREELNAFSQQLRLDRGFEKVWVPHITNKQLYETSGHWAKFGKELFLVTSQETNEQLVMKPMNCPHHQQIYASRMRSYKELPIKYLETTTIYRDEKAGELLGLSRVRAVTQDDSHTFCRPDQIDDIYQMLIEIVQEFYGVLGMTFRARLSFMDPAQPEKYLGEPALWEQAQQTLLHVAKENKLDYYVAEGEAAFYGPKIDFMVRDALGREWQLATPQLDFVQPARFGLSYIDADGGEKTPVMIHFALLGSIERFLSVYIEHTAGNFPLWLSPTHVVILSVGEKHAQHCEALGQEMRSAGLRVHVDASAETVGKKIRNAVKMKVPYVLVVGDKEMGSTDLMIRTRGEQAAFAMPKQQFVEQLQQLIHSRSREL